MLGVAAAILGSTLVQAGCPQLLTEKDYAAMVQHSGNTKISPLPDIARTDMAKYKAFLLEGGSAMQGFFLPTGREENAQLLEAWQESAKACEHLHVQSTFCGFPVGNEWELDTARREELLRLLSHAEAVAHGHVDTLPPRGWDVVLQLQGPDGELTRYALHNFTSIAAFPSDEDRQHYTDLISRICRDGTLPALSDLAE